MKPVTLEMARPSGERERFVALYEAHGSAVLAYARRRLTADEAEDVLAETFLVAWRRRRDVPSDALPWLYAVAGNVVAQPPPDRAPARGAARADRVRSPVGVEDAPDLKLRDALAQLKPIDREALLLTAWEGLTPERAARAAGCSRATFHVRLHRARGRLA